MSADGKNMKALISNFNADRPKWSRNRFISTGPQKADKLTLKEISILPSLK